MDELTSFSRGNLLFFSIYALGLMLLGLISLLIFLKNWRELFSPLGVTSAPPSVSIWNIRWIDFGLFLWLTFATVYLFQAGFNFFAGLFGNEATLNNTGQLAMAALAMEIGVIVAFIVFQQIQSGIAASDLNLKKCSLRRAIRFSLFLFLASFPIIWLVGILWLGVLTLMEYLGWDLPHDRQEMVMIFSQATHPWELVILFILAVVFAPFAEELLFRAAIYRFCKGRMPIFLAMLISAFLFSLLHLNLMSFPSLVVLGLILCLCYEIGGNLIVPVLFHATFNLNSIILILIQP